MTILLKASRKLEKLDKKLDTWKKKTEIKSFMIYRHFTPLPVEANRIIIGSWEPRVSKLIRDLSPDSYEVLRNFFGIRNMKGPGRVPVLKKNKNPADINYYYNLLRDEILECPHSY